VLGSDRGEVLGTGLYLSRDALERNFCHRFEGSYTAQPTMLTSKFIPDEALGIVNNNGAVKQSTQRYTISTALLMHSWNADRRVNTLSLFRKVEVIPSAGGGHENCPSGSCENGQAVLTAAGARKEMRLETSWFNRYGSHAPLVVEVVPKTLRYIAQILVLVLVRCRAGLLKN
jgi:hypothetical protein